VVTPRAMTTGGVSLTFLAPAKINLFLDIIGKRSDGYHDLRSLLAPISLCDEVRIEVTDGVVEAVAEGATLPCGNVDLLPGSEGNLATKAATLLKEVTGYRGGARIRIAKHIPVGGGLGGGSADAAATLRGLNELWRTGLSHRQLMELAARIGCDIPALVCDRVVCMEGRGERITPIPTAWPKTVGDWWLVVVNPCFSVATRDAYSRYKPRLTCPAESFSNVKLALEKGDVELAAGNLFNALQPTVFAKYPLLEILAGELKAAGALGVLLSGSGASLFAMARDREQAQAIEAKISTARGACMWSRAVRVLPDGVTGSTRPFGG
jgi:4-diphosphocytidyl-2-C-methyl-D-erythritol kinase